MGFDLEAISGICGSISIVCWIVVFSPQILENFRRSSADGLSLHFIVVWLAGDLFNILGAVMQGVLPTMLILAVYYTLADIVLLAQCFYYRQNISKVGITSVVEAAANQQIHRDDRPDEHTALLDPNSHGATFVAKPTHLLATDSTWPVVDATHLSPATPLLAQQKPHESAQRTSAPSPSKTILLNLFAVLMIIVAGFVGWWLSQTTSNSRHGNHHHEKIYPDLDRVLRLNMWGQVFGYLCAVLYLGSRVPQIMLNYKRKSTDGISMLFFIFACLGNLTYVLSILAFDPMCEGKPGNCTPAEASSIYGRYIVVNASWLLGSAGTLFLDATIFMQFFVYRARDTDKLTTGLTDSEDNSSAAAN